MELRVSQAKPVSNPQRALSHELDNVALAALDLSLEERARSISCGSPRATANASTCASICNRLVAHFEAESQADGRVEQRRRQAAS